jgi:two-component system, cell cycle response regulator
VIWFRVVGEWDDITHTDQPALVEVRPGTRDRAYLIVLAGAAVGEMYKVPRSEAKIGRGQGCEIRLPDDGVSRHHARLISEGEHILIEDLESRNGTFLNGNKVSKMVPLADGDKIQIGRTTILKFSYHDALEESFHEQMYESALRDALTKLFNKRYFLDRLDGELRFARRHSTTVAVLMADVDHFKAVNDTHGHLAGDAVLANVSQIIARAVRNEDVVARFGGEELAIILRQIPVEAAFHLAERLRRLVETAGTIVGDGPEKKTVKVTVSIGVAAFPLDGIDSVTKLIEHADQALYRAKNGGRNRVSR